MTMVMRSRLTVTKSYRIRTCFPIIRRLKDQTCPHDRSADAGTSCSKLDMLYPTIDWQKKEGARANMRRLVKRLLRHHHYPPEGMEDAIQTVMSQCEMWTDNVMGSEN